MLACPNCAVVLKAKQESAEKGLPFSPEDWLCPHEDKFLKATTFGSSEELKQLLEKNGKVHVPLGIPELDPMLDGGVLRSRLSVICCDDNRLLNAFHIGCGLAVQSKVVYCITADDPLDYDQLLDQKGVATKPIFTPIRCIKQVPALIEEHNPDVVFFSPILAQPYDLVMLWGLAVHYNVAVVGVTDQAELNCFNSGVENIMRFSDTVIEFKNNIIGGTTANVLKHEKA
jgi:hypothetical protein